MNTLNISLGAKGGVGKTLAVLSIADFLTANNVPFAAFDCDTENAGKAAAFSTAYPKAQSINLRSIKDCDKLLNAAAETELTIADLPANAGGDFLAWWDQVATPETLEALNLQIVGIGVITPEAGSFAAIAQWASCLGCRVKYIIGLNHRTQQRVEVSKEEAFPEYFGSKVGKEFRAAFAPQEFEIPGLYEGSMLALAKSGQLPSQAAENPIIPILDRSRIRTWTAKINAQLLPIL